MKKNKIIYIAVIISFIIYLFFSNSIISSFAGNIFSSLKIPHETLMKDKVYSGLKRPNYSSHLFEKVYFEGWALCETENDNSEKEIGILLKNEKEEYIFVNEASTIRKDIKADFSSKAQGNRHGFIYSISTIPISDGMYDIFIYCKENEYNFGLARTRYSLIKHGVNVEIKTTESNIVENLDLSNIIETGIINIDKTETETDGSVSISGWALVPEKGTEEQKVFIRIEDEEGRSAIYDTNSFTRSDVATFFSNDLYLSAGFSANFPIEDATDCKVSVLIQNGDKIYTSSDMNTMLFMSKEIEIREFSNVLEDSIIHIDNKQLKGSAYLDISGWAFVPDQDSSKQKVYIQLTYKDGTSDIFDTRSISRPDVAEFYSNELCTWSGFQAKIPVEMIREKENEISILIEDEDGVHTTPEMFSTVQAYKPSTLERQNVKVESETVYTTEPAGGIMGALAVPLNALMRLCYQWTKNYALAIILFTLFTKIILFPISMWTQRNSIKMVEIMPAINRLKVKYFGDKETIAEETQKLYKQVNYHPLASTVPMLIQIVLLMGVIDAVKAMIGSDANSVYAQIPIQKGGISLLMPVAAAIAAICLGLTQNRIGPLQKEQERKEQIVTNAISVGISLFLGAFVSIGTCVYWIASNLISIPLQVILNKTVNPKKYIDYQALNESKEKLREYDSLSVGISKEDKKREKEDYKKFFSVVNKHLVFYSEGSGYYKYYTNTSHL